MPDDCTSTRTDVQHPGASVSCSPSELLADDLIRLMEEFDGSMRFVPDWSDEPFRRAA
jgi:hypothetical protein